MARKKTTPSTIDRLDPEIQKLIGDLRTRGRTIDEIRAKLAELEVDVSRSALGRHVRAIADVSADLRQSQVYAKALAQEHGASGQSELLDLNGQLLQSQIFRLMLAEADGAPVELAPKDVKALSEAMRNIALTRKSDLEMIEKAEARASKQATIEAAGKASTAARQRGLSAEMADAIYHAVLGSES